MRVYGKEREMGGGSRYPEGIRKMKGKMRRAGFYFSNMINILN